MTFASLAHSRYSCRSYDATRPVEQVKLNQIIQTANLAPSACNAQPYRFFVLTGKMAKEIAQARSLGMNKFIENCPAFIVITEGEYNLTAKIGASLKNQDYRSIDIGIACAQIVLQAQDLGLASCILGMFDESKVQELLECRSRIRLIIALGYAATDAKVPAKKRKPIEEMATFHD